MYNEENILTFFQIDRAAFEYTVSQLNVYFAEAEKGSCSTYCEGCMACLTAYLIYICTETHYEKVCLHIYIVYIYYKFVS